MLTYPQLQTGALCQFPVVRKRRTRTVANVAADGTRFTYADAGGGSIEWRLAYNSLSDAELTALQTFQATAEGSLNGFTFVDPAANLLAWSGDLSNTAWNKDPLMTLSGGIADALGGTDGWRAANGGGGEQSLAQTLNAPGGYLYCFSVYARAEQSTSLTLTAGGRSVAYPVGVGWSRLEVAGAGDVNADAVTFAIGLAAGATVELFGPQVEAQAAASVYKASTTGGVYEHARLDGDALEWTSTDLNRHSVTVSIFYANHL